MSVAINSLMSYREAAAKERTRSPPDSTRPPSDHIALQYPAAPPIAADRFATPAVQQIALDDHRAGDLAMHRALYHGTDV
jgi:hypothetical protein